HVIDGAARLAQAVADGCRHVRVLATSREALGCGEERVVHVAPLDPAGAAGELFIERAAAASGGFAPRPVMSPLIEAVCRRLGGIPLAIELAAARTTHLDPAELLDRLDDQLRLLVGGRRSAAGRHRTLRATIQWSVDLLSPDARRCYPRLAVFAGAFDG